MFLLYLLTGLRFFLQAEVSVYLRKTNDMIKNSKISSHIKQWNIEYDQNGFVSDENWLVTAEKTEDILQLSHIDVEGLILDVGFYTYHYKIFVIYQNDWDQPKEVFESKIAELVMEKLYEFIDKYANVQL